MEFPATFQPGSINPAYITILLQNAMLVTIRHGEMGALDDLISSLIGETTVPILHLAQIIYLILDQFADLNVEAQVAIRDQILLVSDRLSENPIKVSTNDLSRLRSQVENFVSLIENQLYCISGLNASDNELLKDPHRKAFIQDLLSETEIMQTGVSVCLVMKPARYSPEIPSIEATRELRMWRNPCLLTIISAMTLRSGERRRLLGIKRATCASPLTRTCIGG